MVTLGRARNDQMERLQWPEAALQTIHTSRRAHYSYETIRNEEAIEIPQVRSASDATARIWRI